MKAIRTRYYGPTNTRAARIVASANDCKKLSLSHPEELDFNAAHEYAAHEFCKKMGWDGKIVGGGYKGDMFWVFVD